MDDNKIALLRELLSDKEVKETLKKILLEDSPPKITRKRAVKNTENVKTEPKKKTSKKESFKTNKDQVDKLSKDYGRRVFVDDLSEAVEEEINGEVFNLVKESKSLSKKAKKKPVRPKKKLANLICEQCNKPFYGLGGYLCDKCMKGRNINVE